MDNARPDLDEAIWLQIDAEYLYRKAEHFRSQGKHWIAVKIQDNAAVSARLAREVMGIESPQTQEA